MNFIELRMALRPLSFLDAHARSTKGIHVLRTRPSVKLLVWDPEAIEAIFRSDSELLHPGSRSLRVLFGGRSLLWAEGSRHAGYRRVLGPPIQGRRLVAYRDIITSAVARAIDALTPGSTLAPAAWTRDLTLRVIAEILLGHEENEVLAPFTSWIERALGSRYRALAYQLFTGGLPGSGEDWDRTLVSSAKAHRRASPATLAGLMLDDDGPLGGVDDKELRDQLVSLLFAGHETTASATAWTLYRLQEDNALRRGVLDELATENAEVDETCVPLLQAVISEVLRLTPPVTVAENRALTSEKVLLGRTLAPGTILTPSIYAAHRNPKLFSHPRRFDALRFLGGNPTSSGYFPFGGGTRLCLGAQLAQLEIRMIVAAVLRRCEWRCVNPSAGVPELRGHAMAPAARLRMKVVRCRG